MLAGKGFLRDKDYVEAKKSFLDAAEYHHDSIALTFVIVVECKINRFESVLEHIGEVEKADTDKTFYLLYDWLQGPYVSTYRQKKV